jgi:hypothetical protein
MCSVSKDSKVSGSVAKNILTTLYSAILAIISFVASEFLQQSVRKTPFGEEIFRSLCLLLLLFQRPDMDKVQLNPVPYGSYS